MICLLLLRNLTLLPLFQLPGKKALQIKEQIEKQSQNEDGWGPLNYNLLLTAEIQNTSTQLNSSLAGTTTNSNVTPEMLNLDILGHLQKKNSPFAREKMQGME